MLKASEASIEEKKTFLTVVYGGERFSHGDGKLYSVFFQNGKEDKEMSFSKPRGYHSIGTTYLLEKTKDKKYIFPRHGLKEPEKQIEVDEKIVDGWRMDSEEAKNQKSIIAERAKIDNTPEVLNALKPLGDMYYKASRQRQLAIEMSVVKWLRNYWPEGKS